MTEDMSADRTVCNIINSYDGICHVPDEVYDKLVEAIRQAEAAAVARERERVEELEEKIGAALAVLPGQRKPHPDDALQQLVNLARGMLDDSGAHVVYVSLIKGALKHKLEPGETIEDLIEDERLRRAEQAVQEALEHNPHLRARSEP